MENVQNTAIQDTYGERFQHCWGCGPQNEMGLKLKSYPSENGEECLCEFIPGDQFTGGVPDNLFGGFIALAFDCHGGASAAWFHHHGQGLELTPTTQIRRFITARLEVDYKKPVPMGKKITIRSTLEDLGERKVIVTMDMEVAGEIHAKARMIAVAIKDHR